MSSWDCCKKYSPNEQKHPNGVNSKSLSCRQRWTQKAFKSISTMLLSWRYLAGHTLLSFGFAGGEYLAVSVEIRRAG